LFDDDDTVVHITEKAADTAGVPVGGHVDSIEPSEERIEKVSETHAV
jgi:hypothetical protein